MSMFCSYSRCWCAQHHRSPTCLGRADKNTWLFLEGVDPLNKHFDHQAPCGVLGVQTCPNDGRQAPDGLRFNCSWHHLKSGYIEQVFNILTNMYSLFCSVTWLSVTGFVGSEGVFIGCQFGPAGAKSPLRAVCGIDQGGASSKPSWALNVQTVQSRDRF